MFYEYFYIIKYFDFFFHTSKIIQINQYYFTKYEHRKHVTYQHE